MMALVNQSNLPISPSTVVDTTLQDAIASFRAVLTDAQRRDLDSIKSVPPFDAVLTFTAQLDKTCRSHGGRNISTRLCTFLQSVRDFSSIVGTFVSSHPETAALVWGSVRLTMLVIVNFTSYYEAFSELFMNLGRVSPRFEKYQALFPESIHIQRALCRFNASLIRMCQHVVTCLSRSWATQILRALRESCQQEFKPDLDQIQTLAKEVEQEVSLARTQAQVQSQELQRLEQEKAEQSRWKLTQFLQSCNKHFEATEKWQIQCDARASRDEKQRLLDSLSTHDYRTPFQQACRKRHSRTGDWLFQTTKLERWLNHQSTALFWCTGKMGSGKTILASSLIGYLLAEQSTSDCFISFFFSRFDNAESLRAEVILRTIARQITSLADISGETLQQLSNMKSGPPYELIDIKDFISRRISNAKKKVYIVIDGLDECNLSNRKQLLGSLTSLVSKQELCIKVFLTSRERPPRNMKEAFGGIYQVSMSDGAAQADVAEYVEQAVEDALINDQLIIQDQNLIPAIKKALIEHANGMFLWVTLQMREICSQRCDGDIWKAISDRRLPKTLQEIYNRILNRITSANNEKTVCLLLPWLIAARRSLSLSELEEVCCIEILQPCVKTDRRLNGIDRISSWFEGLVEVDEDNETVHLVHASVQEFVLGSPAESALSNFHLDLTEADHHLGEVCVTYLNFEDFQAPLTRRRPRKMEIAPMEIGRKALENDWAWVLPFLGLSTPTTSDSVDMDDLLSRTQRNDAKSIKSAMLLSYPFLRYAIDFWLLHSETFDDKRSKTWELWKQMLTSGPNVCGSHDLENHRDHILECLQKWENGTAFHILLNAAARSERPGTIVRQDMVNALHNRKYLWLKTHLRSMGDVLKEEGCFIAASDGDLKALSIFLEGADISPKKQIMGVSSSLLQETVRRHSPNMKVVELLLDMKTDIHAPASDRTGTVLQEVVRLGQYDLVRQLLDQGADINAPGSKRTGTALQEAAKSDNYNYRLVEYLLDQGAVVNAPGSESSGTALQEAARCGRYEVVKLLLQRGADADAATSKTNGSALGEAVSNHHHQVAELLLNQGAYRDNSGPYSALSLAMGLQDLQMVEILLDRKNQEDGWWELTGHDLWQAAEQVGSPNLIRIMQEYTSLGGSERRGFGSLKRYASYHPPCLSGNDVHIADFLDQYGASEF